MHIVCSSENINDNEFLPGRYTDLTSLKHTVLQIRAPNHESLDFLIGFHLIVKCLVYPSRAQTSEILWKIQAIHDLELI